MLREDGLQVSEVVAKSAMIRCVKFDGLFYSSDRHVTSGNSGFEVSLIMPAPRAWRREAPVPVGASVAAARSARARRGRGGELSCSALQEGVGDCALNDV